MTIRSLASIMVLAALSACIHNPNPIEVEKDPHTVVGSAQLEDSTAFFHFRTEIERQTPLVEAIARLGARDQLVRQMITRWKKRSDFSAEEKEAFNRASSQYMAKIDEAHTRELKRLLRDISWKELSNAGGDLFIKAFFVVQHSPDHEFQSEVLTELEPLVADGLMDTQQYAYLFDRVKLRSGALQLYGTQMECVDGEYDVTALQATETVDERRTKMGLQPLAEYIRFVREYSGSC